MTNAYQAADSFQQLLSTLHQLMKTSRYRISAYIEELELAEATFYRKLKAADWTPQEVKKIAPMLEQQRGKAAKGGSGENL